MGFHDVFTFKFFLEVARPSLRKKKMLSCLTFLVLLLDFVFGNLLSTARKGVYHVSCYNQTFVSSHFLN